MQNSSMPRTTVTLGVLLVAVGVIGWIAAGMSSWTALIPAILGVVLAVCGVLGRSNPKVWIHAALVVAVVGALGTLRNVMGLGDLVAGEAERPLAVISGTVTFVLLVGYVVLGVRSFVAVRRERRSAVG
ncbi:hypothetical protein [Serinicoccus kebangsaanensis]|uniref:hypothetical protein n=1 Tax=Serinicoccus kebangsaanensis TaxID=2602069 RepID=UPI00124EC8F4|nr:hypothetical protein [Serinicoccus kebangsaanensis]